MRPEYSPQYQSGVVIIEDRDFPIQIDALINTAYEYEAVIRDHKNSPLFILRFPHDYDKPYSEEDLRVYLLSHKKQAQTA